MYVQDSIFGAIGVFVTFFVLGGGITYIMRRYLKSRYPNFVKKFKNFGKTEIMFLLTFISVGFYQAVLVYSQIPVVIPLVVKSISLIIGTYTFYLIVNHLIKLWRDFWQKDERLKVRIKSIMVTRRVIRMILFVGCIILVLNTWYVKTFPVFMAIIDFINTNSFTKTIMIFVTYAVIAKTIHYISKTYNTEAIRKHEEGLGDLK